MDINNNQSGEQTRLNVFYHLHRHYFLFTHFTRTVEEFVVCSGHELPGDVLSFFRERNVRGA
jgi:hypothetical protein